MVTRGEEMFLGDSHAPIPRGGAPALSIFLESLLLMPTPVDLEEQPTSVQ